MIMHAISQKFPLLSWGTPNSVNGLRAGRCVEHLECRLMVITVDAIVCRLAARSLLSHTGHAPGFHRPLRSLHATVCTPSNAHSWR